MLFLNFSCFTFQKKYGQADEDCRHGMLISFFLLHSVINRSQLSEFLKLMPRFISLLTIFFPS